MEIFKNAVIFYTIFNFCYSIAIAQTPENFLGDFLLKMANIKSGELVYSVKNKPFFKKDTIEANVHLAFVNLNNTDSFLLKAEITDRTILIYDFQRFFRADIKRKILTVEASNWDEVYKSINHYNYIPITSQGKNLLNYTSTAKLRTKDTTVNNISYKLLHLYKAFSDEDTAFKNLNFYYFLNKDNWVPEKYIFTIEGFGNLQYVELNLFSAKFNHLKEKRFKQVLQNRINDLSVNYAVKQSFSSPDLNKNLLDTGMQAPYFTLQKFGGDSCYFQAKTSELYLLDFWYISCYPCQLAIPHLQKLYMRYAKNGLEVAAIDIYERDTAFLPDLIKRKKITYPIALNGKAVANQFGVKTYPTIFLVDSEGKIIYRSIGFSEAEMSKIETIIKKTLKIEN